MQKHSKDIGGYSNYGNLREDSDDGTHWALEVPQYNSAYIKRNLINRRTKRLVHSIDVLRTPQPPLLHAIMIVAVVFFTKREGNQS